MSNGIIFTYNLQEIADRENYQKYDDDDDCNDADYSQCIDDLQLFYNKQQTASSKKHHRTQCQWHNDG